MYFFTYEMHFMYCYLSATIEKTKIKQNREDVFMKIVYEKDSICCTMCSRHKSKRAGIRVTLISNYQ